LVVLLLVVGMRLVWPSRRRRGRRGRSTGLLGGGGVVGGVVEGESSTAGTLVVERGGGRGRGRSPHPVGGRDGCHGDQRQEEEGQGPR
jgi:hypothetical protein